MTHGGCARPRRSGVTLLELLVVLCLIGLVAAVVAPAIRAPAPARPALEQLMLAAREAAARRGEVVYLRIDASGRWRMEGAASPSPGVIAGGQIAPPGPAPVTVILSPIGTCAVDVPTAAAGAAVGLDPLTCQPGPSRPPPTPPAPPAPPAPVSRGPPAE